MIPVGSRWRTQCPVLHPHRLHSGRSENHRRSIHRGLHSRIRRAVEPFLAARYCLLDKWQRENALDTYEATFLQRQTLSAFPVFCAFPASSSFAAFHSAWNACLECNRKCRTANDDSHCCFLKFSPRSTYNFCSLPSFFSVGKFAHYPKINSHAMTRVVDVNLSQQNRKFLRHALS